MLELFDKKLIFHPNIQIYLDRVNSFKPTKYGASRNYINGSVSYLSPYISRGVISTKFILSTLLNNNYNPLKIEKLSELAWRDYWQQIWVSKGDLINSDLKAQSLLFLIALYQKLLLMLNRNISLTDRLPLWSL